MNIELLLPQAFEAIRALEKRILALEAKYEEHTHDTSEFLTKLGNPMFTSKPLQPKSTKQENENESSL